MEDLITTLMRRDGLSKKEAVEQINEFKVMFFGGELGPDIEEAFMDEFGLEPDYLMDIF